MIYTVTLNPAIDYVVDCENFKEGEVNRSNQEHIYYGGKGINVSAVLKELGYSSECLGFVAGFTGQEIERGTREVLGLQTNFIKLKDGFTRINIKLRGGQETEINGMGPIINQRDIEKIYNQIDMLVEGDMLILSGSVPTSMSSKTYAQMMERLDNKNIKVVVDAVGELLLETLKYKPFLVKPNHHELADIFGVTLNNDQDIEKYARKLQTLGARNVLISMAKEGSLLVDENGQVHRLGVCKGQLVNSVGAGDSMVAGFVAGILDGKDYKHVLELATATGGATAFSEGLATKQKIDELLEQF